LFVIGKKMPSLYLKMSTYMYFICMISRK
jgi:hypothetical protein